MAPSHGPLFDEFRADSGNPHNGAQADTGYGTRGAEPHGGVLFDESYTAAAVNLAHGARYDDFAWRPVPFGHGARFDSNFNEPVAGNPEHGTWHDVFRGGATQANLIVDGRDVQALVIETHADHGVAVTGDGAKIEFALNQLREWRRANTAGAPTAGVKTAQAGDIGVVSAPAASAPQRGSQAAANGGQRTGASTDTGSSAMTVKTIADGDVDVAKRGSAYAVSQGTGKMRVNVGPFCKKCGTTVKKALSGSSMAPHAHVGACRSCGTTVGKTTDETDVAKTDFSAPYHAVTNQHYMVTGRELRAAKPGPLAHPQVHAAYGKALAAHTALTAANAAHTARAKAYAKDPSASYTHLKATSEASTSAHQAFTGALDRFHSTVNRHGLDTIHKTVDATETALQGGSGAEVGHRTNCPRGGSGPCGADEGGKCGKCGAEVHDHQAVGKTLDTLLPILKTIASGS